MAFFDVQQLHLLITAPGGGKTTLIKFELYKGAQKKTYDVAIVFTSSYDDYTGVIEDKYIYTQYSDKTLAKILRFQKEHGTVENMPRLLLIFDDMIGAMNFNTPVVNMLVTQYRHFNIGVVIAIQYCKKVPPTIRESCSKCYILGLNNLDSYKACYESFGQRKFKTLKEFQQFIDENTKDHCFVVVNNKTNDLEKRFEKKRIDPKTIPRDTLILF